MITRTGLEKPLNDDNSEIRAHVCVYEERLKKLHDRLAAVRIEEQVETHDVGDDVPTNAPKQVLCPLGERLEMASAKLELLNDSL